MSGKQVAKPKVTSPRPAPQRRYTFWVTRDADPRTGVVEDHVRVWLLKPDRHRLQEGSVWLGGKDALFAKWTLAECQWHVRTTPDDDRQCIKVDGDEDWEPGKSLNRPVQASA